MKKSAATFPVLWSTPGMLILVTNLEMLLQPSAINTTIEPRIYNQRPPPSPRACAKATSCMHMQYKAHLPSGGISGYSGGILMEKATRSE